MAKQNQDRAAATAAFVEVALDEAYSIREEASELVKRRKASRDQLRSLKAQGFLSHSQAEEVDELYPPRSRNGGSEDDESVTDDEAIAA